MNRNRFAQDNGTALDRGDSADGGCAAAARLLPRRHAQSAEVHSAARKSVLSRSALGAATPRGHHRPRPAGGRFAALHRQGEWARRRTSFRFAISEQDLARGRERFNIYCSPCHSQLGDGNGMIVQRGFKKSSFVLRAAAAEGSGGTLLQRDDQRLGRHGRLLGAGSGGRPLAHRGLHPRAAAFADGHEPATCRPERRWPAMRRSRRTAK